MIVTTQEELKEVQLKITDVEKKIKQSSKRKDRLLQAGSR